MKAIEIRNLSKRYGNRLLFSKINLDFPDKGLFAIVGESGSGKTSLLEIIGGIDDEYLGSITIFGDDISKMDEEDRSELRMSKIGYIRQQYDLLELETSLFNVSLPLKARNDDSKNNQLRKSSDLLSGAGLGNKKEQRCQTLSGGEKQRTALSRSLSLDPKIILADEPTGALDERNGEMLFDLLLSLSKDRLVILVSHDIQSVKKIADKIYKLDDGQLVELENVKEDKKTKPMLNLPTPPKKGKRASLLMWIKHSSNLLFAKKRRTILSMALLIFSLTSFGLSVYMSNGVKNEISEAFSSLIGKDELVVERKSATDSQFGKIISASEEEVSKIQRENKDIFSFYGVSYLVDLNSFFPERNEFKIKTGNFFHDLDFFSMTSIMDYSQIGETPSLSIFPSKPPALEDDQIILGLSYETMAKIAYSLGVFRDYKALGNYLLNHDVYLFYEVENLAWKYSDEEIFRIMGFAKSEKDSIFHYSHLWNKYVIEDKMRFHPIDEGETSMPWDFQKAYYLVPDNANDIMEKIRENEKFQSFVFEKTNHIYSPLKCPISGPCNLDRYYVYIADKKTIGHADISTLASSNGINGHIIGANGSYVCFPSSLMEGFSFPFFLSTSLSEIESAIDQISYLPTDQYDLNPTLGESTVEGHYLLPKSSSLSLSNDFSSLLSGRPPSSIDEICISSALCDKLHPSPSLYCAAQSNESQVGDFTIREYATNKLKVVGVVEDKNDVMYVKSYWAIDYFRERVGVSSFNLEPSSIILNVDGSSDISKIKDRLSSEFPLLKFSIPSLSIGETISSTMEFLKIALIFGSVGCLALSLILLIVIAYLSILESDKEGQSLFIMGFSRKEIMDGYFASSLCMVSVAGIISLIATLAIELISHRGIGEAIGISTKLGFDVSPFVSIIAASLFGLLISSLVIYRIINKKDFIRRGI